MTEPESRGGIGNASSNAAPAAAEQASRWPVVRLYPSIVGWVVLLILFQHGVEGESRGGLITGIGLLLACGAGALFSARKTIHNTICSVPFAVALLTSIAAATAIGTFVPQGVKDDFLTQHYGASATNVVKRLYLTDLFHSYWYGGLLTIMVVSLITLVLRRPFWRPVYWGFALGHGGMVITIVGAVIGSFYGMHGMMALHKGAQSADVYVGGSDGVPKPPVKLAFALRLDDFEVERYRDELRFVVLEIKGHDQTEPLTTIKPEQAKDWVAVPKTNLSFRVRELTPASRGSTGPRHLLQAEGGSAPLDVEIGQTYTAPGTKRPFRVIEFIPDFYFDMQQKRGASRSNEPNNPALLIEEPAGGKDGAPRRQWLFAKMPGHGQKEGDLPLKYTYLDSRFPTVTVDVREKGEETPSGDATLTATDGPGSACRLSDEVMLVFEERPGEPKAYRSKVSVLDGGNVVRSATVAVNAPLNYGGYEFYQSDWRKEDLNYSGLKVVRDPGLNLVYFGMVCVSLGVLFVYYLRPRLVPGGTAR